MHVRARVSHGWACLWFDLVPIWFPNQKSITVAAAAVGTNQPGKDGHYKLIEGRAEETIRLIDSIDTGGEDDDAQDDRILTELADCELGRGCLVAVLVYFYCSDVLSLVSPH